jgi:adenine-specific DNA-methyltransferase
MKLELIKPIKGLNKAYLKEKVSRHDIEVFKLNLQKLLARINEHESEEHLKNVIADFLKDTWYKEQFEINTKDRSDLVIHNGKTSKENVGVILEVKKPSNKGEMISISKPNSKAIHELILYYLRERFDHSNTDIKHLIITNIYEWYIIDEIWFEKNCFRNTKLKKDFENWKLSGKDTKFFYESIAKVFLDEATEAIPIIAFDIRDYEKYVNNDDQSDDTKLIGLYKILSPTHLLKQPFTNDSNTLDTKFYSELLHIIGLQEIKDGGKKIIKRKLKSDEASILENTIIKLEDNDILRNIKYLSIFGSTKEEQLYNVALELSITWINRILFIKLLEAQLYKYNRGNKDYLFLNSLLVYDFDELCNLFFQVLAEKPENRRTHLKDKFKKVPYLNSSLFERTELERQTINVSELDNRLELPIFSNSVLKDNKGKKISGSLPTLRYLFEFLDSYDFTSSGAEEIQEENKNLINASVLGLIFEKINGYKDGSFFTPGFVTMYMCKEALTKSVLNKFNTVKKWNCINLDDLYNKIEDKKEANQIINSLRICDPAVGSGHYLVSALNEIISIKSNLKILQDLNNKSLRDYHVEVINDEMIITDEDGKLFDYNPNNKESQRIQEALFHEKEIIIENCLFGVDINPNSVKICRLRLWIELLKNAYYTSDSNYLELETLPNIDINIKCGNSLISRFSIDADITNALKNNKWSIESYKKAVQTYREAESKEQKREMEELINDIKNDFQTVVSRESKPYKDLAKLEVKYFELYGGTLFNQKLSSKEINKRSDLSKLIDEKKGEIENIRSNRVYENAFEWRFEFPEVLDDQGNFIGFDIIIGNPPYIGEKEMSNFFNDIKKINEWASFYRRRTNIYYFFFKKGNEILKTNGILTFIVPREFLTADWANKLRHYLLNFTKINSLIDFDKNSVFEDAGTTSLIFSAIKLHPKEDYQFDYFLTVENNKKISDLNLYNGFSKKTINYSNIDVTGTKSWAFNQSEITGDCFFNLGKIFDVVQGLVTGVDKVTKKHISLNLCDSTFLERGIFILTENIDILHKESLIYLKINDDWIQLPNDEVCFIKPFVYSVNIKKWYATKSNDYVIYFGKNDYYPEVIISYLLQFKKILINRTTIVEGVIEISEFDKFTIEEIKRKFSSAGAVQKIMRKKQWYKPLYERADYDFDSIKFIVNSKNKTEFCLSLDPCYSSGGGLGGQNYLFPKLEDDYLKYILRFCSLREYFYFICGILNSSTIGNFINEGKYNQLSIQKIQEIQIYQLDFSTDKEVFLRLVNLVKAIILKLQQSETADIRFEQTEVDNYIELLYNKST